MTIEEVHRKYGSLPYMGIAQAKKLRDLITESDLSRCLELGFFHGKSSAFIASILKERQKGHLTTIDRTDARERRPNIDDVLSSLELENWVTVFYEARSYTWRLMKMLEHDPTPRYDFCYIDGGHSWDNTGFGFCLVDRLLVPGGWIVFDDLDWTFSSMMTPGEPAPDWLAAKTEEEIRTPQVRKVWELLVKPHPSYGDLREDGQWGYARKIMP